MELLYYVIWVVVLSIMIYAILFGSLMLIIGHRRVQLRAILAGLVTVIILVFFTAIVSPSVTYRYCEVPSININYETFLGSGQISDPIGSCDTAKKAVILIVSATLIALMGILAVLLLLELGWEGQGKIKTTKTVLMDGAL